MGGSVGRDQPRHRRPFRPSRVDPDQTFEPGWTPAARTDAGPRLAERHARAWPGRDPLLTREPGGTALGARIAISSCSNRISRSQRAETLLYCVARAQLVEQVLRPAFLSGRTVIVDRYADSTLAYQAYGRDLDRRPFAGAGLRHRRATTGPDLPA